HVFGETYWRLACAAVAASALLAGAGVLVGAVHGWRGALLLGMSLAFATVPAELPLAARAALALGTRALARHGLLVRRVAAADALATVSVVVTDKTGTLTRSRLVVSSLVAVSADPAAACGLAVEVLTPEAAQLSERSAALATPLYAAWALSVDPLEARPLAQRVAAIQAQGLIQTQPQTWGQGHKGHRGHQTQGRRQGRPIEPVRGFGKDFLNSAVLSSLPAAAGDDDDDNNIDAQKQLPRDPDTGSVPVLAITDAISALCNCLSEPTGELPFDAALRVSARTRTAAAPPASFARRRPNDTGDGSSANNVFAAKHWTVIKGAPEALVPQCTRVWRAAAAGDDVLPAPLLADDICAGRVAGIDAMPAALAQTIARSAATLAAGGSRVIAYALAITDEPLYAPVEAAPAAATTLDVEDAAHPLLLPLPSDLVFVGAFAFFDPPQREARPVVQECQDAGIRVILATGDHPSTALSVASAVGIVESHNYHHNSRAAERLPPPIPPPLPQS
ncbi:hypothetical protein GGF44_004875, partial [Coemansia sp. RSA 1694]